jgi:circadian clock protein KaiB
LASIYNRSEMKKTIGQPKTERIRKTHGRAGVEFFFQLFVVGTTRKSALAITNVKQVFEQHLKNRYSLEIIDLYQQPHLARGEQIIAAPTLVKKVPTPLRRFIGDLSDPDRLLASLQLT